MRRFRDIRETAVEEEVPANNAGSGSVAGLGSEPPVSKAAQKKKKKTAEIARRKSVEIEERVGPALTFEFPDDKKAKQFDQDIENSSIGLGNRTGNKVKVTGVDTKWRAALKKAMLKNKGKLVTENHIMQSFQSVSTELDEALSSKEAKQLENGIYDAVMDMLHQDAMHTDLDLGDKDVKKAVTKATQRVAKDISRMKSESVELDESQRFGGKTNIPASKETTKYIESGKGLILDVPSALHPTARFAIHKNPAKGSGQDKVLMATTSNPKRGRVKMFSFHGTHVSHQKAMDFAKKHKLVAMKDKDGNPLYAKESVDESTGTFAGCKVFKVSSEEYGNCVQTPRKKNERWKRKLNMEMHGDIRQYAHRNPGKPIIVQDENSGAMSYLIVKSQGD